MATATRSKQTTYTRHSQLNSKFHNACFLTDVETTKVFEDFPIHMKDWRFPAYNANVERLLQLSQPKEPKTEWYTAVGPHVKWGTQEMMWPIKKETLTAGATERVDTLALPKLDFLKGDDINRPAFFHSCGRSSVIWNVAPGAKQGRSTGRVQDLAQPKKFHNEYKDDRLAAESSQYKFSCGRQSPIWNVQRQTMSCGDRPYTNQLAKHKESHKDFLGEKSIKTEITKAALKAMTSERIHMLSTPKPRNEGQFREPGWEVSKSAQNASASSRCLELARPKHVVDGYQLPRDEQWGVSRAAKRAATTSRLEELSKPVHRATMDHVQFNPDAFMVKPLALKGTYPPRVDELAKPIER